MIVDDVVKSALKLLDTNKACSDYIRGTSPNSPYTELAQLGANHLLTYFNGVEGDPNEGPAVAATRGWWTGRGGSVAPVRVALMYDFFQNDVGGYTTWAGVGTTTARIEVILHELRHVMIRQGHPSKRESDPESSYDYNKNIFKKCFGVDVPPPAN